MCQCIWLRSQPTWSEADPQVELQEEFGPPGLLVGELLGGSEVFQVLVVCHCIDSGGCTFQEMSPALEGFKNCQQLLVLGFVVMFCALEHPGEEGNWADLIVRL